MPDEPWRTTAWCYKHRRCERIVAATVNAASRAEALTAEGFNVHAILNCGAETNVMVSKQNLTAVRSERVEQEGRVR